MAKKRRRKQDWTDWIHELILGALPLIIALIALFVSKAIGKSTAGIILFILTITLGLTVFFVFLFQKKELSIRQFLFSMGAIIALTWIVFGIVYTIPGDTKNYMMMGGERANLNLWDGLYFSGDTLATLGYGDIIPRGSFRIFAIIEVALGLLYLGIFIAGIGHIYDQ